MLRGIMLNEDDTHFYFTRHKPDHACTREEIEAFIDQYAGTQVTDFLLCLGGRLSDFPSTVRESYVEKYLQKIENGVPVNYTNHPVVASVYDLFVRQKLDFYAICIERLRKIGIRPWASVRMNDCHDNADPTSFLHPDSFHDHPELRRVRHRSPTGYYDRNLDYGEPAVYDLMIRYVEEVVNRYDVDGLELDWQRENYCFRVGYEHEGTQIINRFMRDTRAVTERAAAKWGHPIKIGARVFADPIQSAANGFNVLDWAREGTVDTIVPTARWRTTDTAMPIDFWKQILGEYPVELAAGLEILLSPWQYADRTLLYQTTETVHAQAAQYLTMGADKIYLFNFMDAPDQYGGADEVSGHPCRDGAYQKLLSVIGGDAVVREPRRHIVTFADVGPVFWRMSDPLPRTLTVDDYLATRVMLGTVPSGAKMKLLLGVRSAQGASNDPALGAAAEAVSVYVNSAPVRYVGTEELSPRYVAMPCLVYEIEPSAQFPPCAVVETAAAQGELVLEYVEIRIG